MVEVLQKDRITNMLQKAEAASKIRKDETLSKEAVINNLLDEVLSFKKSLQAKTIEIEQLVLGLEELTWNAINDEDALANLKKLIANIDKVHSINIKFFVGLNFIRSKGIAKEEITKFKHSLDNLIEAKNDLVSVFFVLPKDHEFQEITKELSDLK